MRKTSLFVLVFFAVIAAAWAATITVGSPRAGDVLCKGRTYQIRWASSGVSGRVMVRLMQGRVAAAYLSWDTENDGLFDYTVSDRLPAGDYTVAVLSRGDSSVRGESGSFRIDACLATVAPPPPAEVVPLITVANVGGRIRYDAHSVEWIGGMFPVRWTTRGRMPAVVNISLHPPDCSGVGTFLSTVNTSAGEQWVRIPSTISAGNYSIRVGQFGSSLYGCSEAFHLRLDLIVTEPNSGTIWHPGESVVVRWRRISSTLSGAFMILYGTEEQVARGECRGSLEDYVVDTAGEFRRILPATIPPGRYAICLANGPGWGTGACSDFFQVVAR